jgi:hypothetical protein
MNYIFIGKQGKYQIPNGEEVVLIKTYSKRKYLIEWQGKKYITFVSLLRRGKNDGLCVALSKALGDNYLIVHSSMEQKMEWEKK